MVIDIEERCKALGIDDRVRFSAERKVDHAFSESWDGDDFTFTFDKLPDILAEDELVAYIRWNGMHKQYPEWFTWDGAKNRESALA